MLNCKFIEFHNTAVFSEILVRYILYQNLAEPKIEDNSFSIEFNVKGSIYQVDIANPTTEMTHCYKAFIDLDNSSLSFQGPWIVNSLDAEGVVRFYESMSVYASYLYRLDLDVKKQLGFSLTKSIKNWNNFFNSEILRSFSEHISSLNIRNTQSTFLEIDKKSDFILITDKCLNNVREAILDKCRVKLLGMHGVSYETMLNYVRAVEEPGTLKMKRLLATIDNLKEEKTIRLFIELTQCPCLDDYLLTKWKSDLESEVINSLTQCSIEEIILFLVDLKKFVNSYPDDENYTKNLKEWMIGIVRR